MISIIIPVKNDRNIEKTLNLLRKIKKPEKIEIVVVDASEGNLDDIKKKFPKVSWIYFHNKTSKKYTFTEQINLGLKRAKGDLIAFIDADCIPKKDWLVELYRPIKEDNEDYVTGLVKSIGENSIHDKGWSNLNNLKYRTEAGSANTLFKKKIILDIGYYDESFEAGSDIDFSWRAIKAGYKIRYNPKAVIFDDWGTFKQDLKRGVRYGKARVNLYKKHKDKRRELFIYNKDLFSIYNSLFFFYIISIIPVTFFWNWYPIFLLVPILRNIKINPLRKMAFDFSWGYGFIKRLFEITFLKKN